MPVYNAAKYLPEAIDSILSQTFQDFEFLIINDGSTDQTEKIINSYTDQRIRLVSQDNQGLSVALNKGLNLARGKYIARMDADDISLPERLAKQAAFMDSHPAVGICGTGAMIIDEQGQAIRRAAYPLSHEEIEVELLFNSTFAHPAVMFRRSVLQTHNLNYHHDKGEDFELWTRAVKVTKLANLKECLIKYRLGVGISFNACKADYERCFWQIIRQQLDKLPGKICEAEIITHRQMADYTYRPDRQFLKLMFAWLIKIKAINRQAKLYQAAALNRVLARQWLAVCQRAGKAKLLTWPEFWLYTARLLSPLTWRDKFWLLKKLSGKLY